MPRFVIQEHYARSRHFDLRLEKDGAVVEGVADAVRVMIRDQGTYEAEEFGAETVIVTLRGGRLRDRYAIFRAGDNWLVHLTNSPGEERS